MNKRTFTTIIFDADDTLIDYNKSAKDALEHVLRILNIYLDETAIDDFIKIDNELFLKANQGNTNMLFAEALNKRFEVFFKKYSINYEDYSQINKWYGEGLANSVAPYQKSHDIIERLYLKGYDIVVLTNGLINIQYPRVNNNTFAKYLKRIFVSKEIGVYKPDIKAFNYLLNKMNITKEEAIMVGDNLHADIKGANNAGIKSIWFNPNNLVNNTNIKPDYEISDIYQIEAIINSIK